MPLPLVGLLLGKGLAEAIKLRVGLVFKMQELAGQFVLGGYSAIEGQDTEVALKQIENVKIVINALIFISGPPLLISVYGDKISANSTLYAYFSQFPNLRKHLEAKARGEIQYVDKLTREIAENVLSLYNLEYDEKLEEGGFINPLDVANLIIQQIQTLWESFVDQDPFKFALHVSQSLVNADYPDSLYNIPEWLARLLNPFIDLDFAVISSLIMLFNSQYKSVIKLEIERIPRAWIPGMRGVLKADDQVIAESYVLKDGSIYFESKSYPDFINKMQVDLHGFKYSIPVWEICSRSKYYSHTTGEWYYLNWTKGTHIRGYLTLGFRFVWLVAAQDQPETSEDFMHDNDVALCIFEEDNYYLVYVYVNTRDDPNDFYYQNIYICTIPTGQEAFDEVVARGEIEEKANGVMKIDKETYNLIEFERRT